MSDRGLVWIAVMGGPVLGTIWGAAETHSPIGLGWLGLILIPAHPARPCGLTACVTLFGFSLWFFAGFFMVGLALWGG